MVRAASSVKQKGYNRKAIQNQILHNILFAFIEFIAISASISGTLMTNSDGSVFKIPVSILKTTQFEDFFIPGILLTIFVGGSNIIAAAYFLAKHKNKYNWSLTGGFILINWIILQMIFIQSLSWLQMVYLCTGLFIILLSLQLKGKWLL